MIISLTGVSLEDAPPAKSISRSIAPAASRSASARAAAKLGPARLQLSWQSLVIRMSTAASFWIRSNDSVRTVLNAMELVGSSIPKPEDIRHAAASNFRILRVQFHLAAPARQERLLPRRPYSELLPAGGFPKNDRAVDAWNFSIFPDQFFLSKSFLMQSQNKATHMQKMRDDLHENL